MSTLVKDTPKNKSNKTEKNLINLIKFIKSTRKIQKISGTKLALDSGLSKNYITMLESGKLGTPRVDSLYAIAKTLKIKPEKLLSKIGYTVEPLPKPGLGDIITVAANDLGLSNNLADSLADIVNAVLVSQQHESISRAWLRDVVVSYFYDMCHDEKGNVLEDKTHYMNWATDLIDYADKQEFNIEDIDV